MKDLRKDWEETVAKKLLGRKIVGVKYLSPTDTHEMGWAHSAVVLILDDGHELMPMYDDEGNGAGAIATTYSSLTTIPGI